MVRVSYIKHEFKPPNYIGVDTYQRIKKLSRSDFVLEITSSNKKSKARYKKEHEFVEVASNMFYVSIVILIFAGYVGLEPPEAIGVLWILGTVALFLGLIGPSFSKSHYWKYLRQKKWYWLSIKQLIDKSEDYDGFMQKCQALNNRYR